MKAFLSLWVALGVGAASWAAPFDRWAVAQTVCAELIVQVGLRGEDPGHRRVLSDHNRFLFGKMRELAEKVGRETDERQLIHRLHADSPPAEVDYIPAEFYRRIVTEAEALGAKVYLSAGDSSYFSLQSDGSPILALARHHVEETRRLRRRPDPTSLAHELEHLRHWHEIAAVLRLEMNPAEAAVTALWAMNTPEGTWITESRATAVQLRAAQELGLTAGRPTNGSQIYTATELVQAANYPASAALEQGIRYHVLLLRLAETNEGSQELLQRVDEKLLIDLDAYADDAVATLIAQWVREEGFRHRNPIGRMPQHYEEFFALAPAGSEDAFMMRSAVWEFLHAAGERYRLAHNRVEQPLRFAPAPSRRRWWQGFWPFR